MKYSELREKAQETLVEFGAPLEVVFGNEKGEVAALAEIAIGLTVFFIVVGYILAPVGLVAFGGVNRSAAGVASGTTSGAIWDALVPVSVAGIILGLVMIIKKQA